MIISVYQQPQDDGTEFEDLNFSVNAEFQSNEDTTAYGVINMCFKAMEVEGYMDESIIQAMYDLAMEKANEKNYMIKEG